MVRARAKMGHGMDPEKRISELEAQVRQLSGLVRQLLEEGQPQPAQTGEDAEERKRRALIESAERATQPALVQDMRKRMDRALRSGDGNIETRIGAVWLSRLATVFAMTAIALAARTTFWSDAIGPPEKVVIGYLMAVMFIAYGMYFRRREDLFAKAILGCGLAALYFTTYAVFFIDQMRLDQVHQALGDSATPVGIALVTVCLLLLTAIAHFRRSQTVAGIGLFLAYYTVVVACNAEPSFEAFVYALTTGAIIALITLVFHFAHRWLLFSWVALISTHLTYIYFFVYQNRFAELDIPPETYFWLSNGFLAVVYVLFSLTCIMDARKTGEYRRTVAPMAGVNSFIFFSLTWFSIREHYPDYEWAFRSAFALLLLFFAGFAETTGPRRNYLFQIFIAKTVIMVTLALEAYLSGSKLIVAMAIECLALGFSYKRSGIVVFKVLGLLLMLVTLVACLANVRTSGTVFLFGYTMPANWFSAVGSAFFFCVVAWFYEKFVRRLRPEHRVVSGQWFLADSVLDLHSATLALLHAAAAALVLFTITVFERGDDVALPYFLAGEGMIMAALGLVLVTPQVEIGSVLLLASAHVCYYIFLYFPPVSGFETQPFYALYTSVLAVFTYIGAYAWERYLRRYHHADAVWEHYLVAAVPYLAATVMLAILLSRQLGALYVPPAQGALGMALLLVGSLTGFPAVKASGVLAMGLAGAHLYFALFNTEAPITGNPDFLLYFGLFLFSCVGAERLFVLLERRERQPSRIEEWLRTLLVAGMAAFGAVGLYRYASDRTEVFYLLALAVLVLGCGALFRESRYRWAAMCLFAAVIFGAFRRFRDPTDLQQVLTFAAPAAVLLVVSWAYSRGRKRQRAEQESKEQGGGTGGGAQVRDG